MKAAALALDVIALALDGRVPKKFIVVPEGSSMSWSDRPLSSLDGPALLVGMAFGLGGCFTPLYATVGGNSAASCGPSRSIPCRTSSATTWRDELITDLNGTGAKPAPHYRLQLTTTERVQTALIDITTQRAQDGSLVTDVTWKLIPIEGGAPVATGSATSFATYDRSSQRFANIRAARDAEIRDAKSLADQITTQVAASWGRSRSHPDGAL